MAASRVLVSEQRKYLVTTVAEARLITRTWLEEIDLVKVVKLGLPEIDDRHHIWRVPLCDSQMQKIGELVIDAYSSGIDEAKSTKREVVEARLLKKLDDQPARKSREVTEYGDVPLRNTIAHGDCVKLIDDLPAKSIDLIFTSPPYFNARPEYTEYEEYQEYLHKMRQVITRSYRALKDGRFFVMNTAPVLLRRASRSQASKRIAVPFDLHAIFVQEGFEFIDDIIWVKPEGAGWATGRGRRFAADRNPLQYKAVPVTEYVLVYRKTSDELIDWHIRSHPDQTLIKESKIADGYEKTNVWKINPITNSKHPAAFPLELASKVVQYYSFKGDVVMDPFAGSGTVGVAAAKYGRKFVLFEKNLDYIPLIRDMVTKWSDENLDVLVEEGEVEEVDNPRLF